MGGEPAHCSQLRLNFDGNYLSRQKGNDLVYAGKADPGFDKSSTAERRVRP
jgi:bifunctional non-homologous end joining protein LigD